jgi:hypothetical protein
LQRHVVPAAPATKAELTACISQLDCLNSGKSFGNGILPRT